MTIRSEKLYPDIASAPDEDETMQNDPRIVLIRKSHVIMLMFGRNFLLAK